MKLALLLGTVAAAAGALMATQGPGERALAALKSTPAPLRYLGYVEGETTLVAPPVSGRLVDRPVERGERIDKGHRLFVIDTTQAETEVARAAAGLAEMQARHSNLLTGKRVEEQDVVRAQRRQVEATLVAAEAELGRQSELVAKNIVSRHNYDQAFANVAELRARVAALTARERAGDLAARQPEIDAAAALIEQQQAILNRAKMQLADLMPVAPDRALVENTFFNVGEWVPAGSPVVSLLPDFRVKLRFFIPEPEVAKVRAGTRIRFNCDGCPPGLEATVTYVAPRAEYTPPIIYSHGARANLVFMVEARPDPMDQLPLQPGLPITVEALSLDAKTWAWR
ncbi:MAG: HlyD family efflux transporter periplasmic adaptor subunit [Rhodospirillales bacterium]|nr:HlyD family efflux transporter periplasmic adaptor subunit [Rhodospirillales bacterium]